MLSGNVASGDYASGGLPFDSCVNVYPQMVFVFTLGGTTGGCDLYFEIMTYSQLPTSRKGGCTTNCYQFPKVKLTYTTGLNSIFIYDTEGTGLPADRVEIGKEIVGLQWRLQSPASVGDGGQGAACTGVNLTIDDVSLTIYVH